MQCGQRRMNERGFLLGRLAGVVVAGGVVLLGSWFASRGTQHQTPSQRVLSSGQRQLAVQLVPNVVADLRQARQDVHSVVLLPFAGDPTNYVSDQLRAAIEQTGLFALHSRSLTDELRQKLKLSSDATPTLAKALKVGHDAGVQGVLFGQVETQGSTNDGASLNLHVCLAQVAGGKLIFDRHYTRAVSGGPVVAALVQGQAGKAVTGGKSNSVKRFLGWLLVILLLPVFTISFIRTMVRKESNQTNAVVLAIYTAADALFALLILGAVSSFWTALLFLGLLGAAFSYNVAVMTFALKMEVAGAEV